MNSKLRFRILETSFLLGLLLGLFAIATAQNPTAPQKKVKVEVEVTENGKTSRSVQELTLDQESISGQLDEMVEEIEMILEEAVRDVEQTDLEITIRRNSHGLTPEDLPQYHNHISVVPMTPPMPGVPYWNVEMPQKAFLGVYASGLGEEQLKEYNIEKGAHIDGVVEGSAAEAAGLQKGDIILSIGGDKVGSFEEVSKAVRSREPGAEVSVVVLRDGTQQEFTATLGKQSIHSYSYETKSVSRAYLGVKGRNIDAEDTGLGVQDGAYLTEVVENTPAAKGGLQQGDVIVSMDGEPVGSFEELGEVIRSREAGEEVEVEVMRNGNKETLNVTLGEQKISRDYNSYGGFHGDYLKNLQHIQPNMEELEKKAFLGIMGSSNDGDKGVVINDVFDNSAASDMGLQEGDMIYKLNDTEIQSIDELVDFIGEMAPGDQLEVAFERDGKKMQAIGPLRSKAEHHNSWMPQTPAPPGKQKTTRMTISANELNADEIRELNKTAGQNFDENNSLEVSDFSLTPNPNNGHFQLSLDLPTQGHMKMQVLNQAGQVVSEEEIRDFSGIYSKHIDISEEPAGVYFMSITQNGKGKVYRIVKN